MTQTANTMILGFADYLAPAERLAEVTGLPLQLVQCHLFPDGESRITLPTPLPRQVVICRSLHHPNEKLVELMLTAQTARDLGVERVLLLAPYLCYMRQDMAFHRGEAISQRIIGGFLQHYFDGLITVDPHLHRITDLTAVVHCQPALVLSAMPAIAQYIRTHFKHAYLIGPDEESEQWLTQVAQLTGSPYVVGRKRREGDQKVQISLPRLDLRGREALIIDDIASTARTLTQTIKALIPSHPADISVLVTHGLFVGDALESLQSLGLKRLISTDSIPHPSNAIELAPLLGEGLLSILESS